MKVSVYSKELKVSGDVEERITERLSFLEKYGMVDSATVATAMVKKHGSDVKLEITVPSKIGTLRAEVIDPQLNDAIDFAVGKLESQIRRQKTRLSRRHREKLSKAFVEEIDVDYGVKDEKVTKTKRIVVDDLEQDEAIMQMELVGHDFFVYRDKDTQLVSIVYKRETGDYGILEIV